MNPLFLEILFIIEEFEIGSINAFECVNQIKEKIKDYD